MYLYSKVAMTEATYERFQGQKASGKVLDIFTSAVLIMTWENDYIILTDMYRQTGPNILCIKNFQVALLNIKRGMSVEIVDQTLRLADLLVIDFTQSQLYVLVRNTFPQQKHNVWIKLLRIQRSDWYLTKRMELQNQPRMQQVRILIDDHVLLVHECMVVKNQQVLRETLQQFVGLGIGIMPSGDNFLMGLAYIAGLSEYPYSLLYSTLNILLPVIEAQTNQLSAQYFHYALQGEMPGEVVQAVQAIISDETYEDIEEEIRAVLTLEIHSGYDILTGIIAAFQIAFA